MFYNHQCCHLKAKPARTTLKREKTALILLKLLKYQQGLMPLNHINTNS